MLITDGKSSVCRISRCIECCINFHNLLVDIGNDPIPDEWWDSADDTSEIGSGLGEHDLVAPILKQDKEDELQQHCKEYFQ